MTLLEKYIISRWHYAIGEDYISDMEYKYIEEKLTEELPENEYLSRSWSDDPCPIALLKKYGMERLIRNIEFSHKSESIPSLNSESKYIERYQNLNTKTRVSYKIDGWNTQVNYFNGVPVSANTRGRSGNFLNANTILQIVPKKISLLGKIKVTGEVSIPKKKWPEYQLLTGNTTQRNSVSTALANGDGDYLSFLTFNIQSDHQELEKDRYKILMECGFKTPYYVWVENFTQLDKAIDLMSRRDKAYNYLTDGLVVEDGESQIALRIRGWEEKCLFSYVTGYTEKRGSYGDSMVVDFAPVKVEGYLRAKVNVTNIQCIIDNNLFIGAPIAFDIRSAAGCVINTVRTAELQEMYKGKLDVYHKYIDKEREA